MHLRLLDYALWVTSPVLQTAVVVLLMRRGLHREYPFFFNYTILSIVSEPILFFVHEYASYTAYYYAYWINTGLSVLVSFMVLQEIFNEAFRPYEALRDLGVILFRWSALVVMLVGVMWAVNSGQNSDNGAVTDVILLASRSVRLMQCGLVFFLLLFSEYLGISRRSLLFGMSLGFGLFASVNMLVVTGMTHHGIVPQSTLSKINSAAYSVAALIWLGYTVIAPARSKAEAIALRSGDWNIALEDARGPMGADSLLDTMDRTVERLLYPPEESKVKITTSQG